MAIASILTSIYLFVLTLTRPWKAPIINVGDIALCNWAFFFGVFHQPPSSRGLQPWYAVIYFSKFMPNCSFLFTFFLCVFGVTWGQSLTILCPGQDPVLGKKTTFWVKHPNVSPEKFSVHSFNEKGCDENLLMKKGDPFSVGSTTAKRL